MILVQFNALNAFECSSASPSFMVMIDLVPVFIDSGCHNMNVVIVRVVMEDEESGITLIAHFLEPFFGDYQ